jgi:hypothetical protein
MSNNNSAHAAIVFVFFFSDAITVIDTGDESGLVSINKSEEKRELLGKGSRCWTGSLCCLG